MAIVIAGLTKLTLLDYPDRTACTLFTAGCNFACPFCHNPSLIPLTIGEGSCAIDEEYILKFLESRRGLIDAVCISGGEPLMQDGILEFALKVKELGYLVKIDTNGSFPGVLRELAEAGALDYVAMDIKNTPSRYGETVGIPGYDTADVLSSIELLLSGAVECEFRTTVVRDYHTADDIIGIARLIPGAKRYYLQRFENPDSALRPGLGAYSEKEMLELLARAVDVLPTARLRGN